MKPLTRAALGAVLVVLVLLAVRTAIAQDPVKVAPNSHKVLLENERVRVLEVRLKPGEKMAMHSHPDHVVYSLSGGKRRRALPYGIRRANTRLKIWVPPRLT